MFVLRKEERLKIDELNIPFNNLDKNRIISKRQWNKCLRYAKEIRLSHRFYIRQKVSFKNEGDIKTFSREKHL